MRSFLIIISLCFVLLSYGQVSLDFPQLTTRNTLSLNLGIEPELTISLSYLYKLNPSAAHTQFSIGAGVKLPPMILHNGNWRAHLITAIHLQSAGKWRTTLQLLPYYARSENEAGIMDGLGLEIRAMPVHYGIHWANGIDLGWQKTWLTYVYHSEIAKATFDERYTNNETFPFSAPVDGWYKNTGQRFRIGYAGGKNWGERLAFQFSLGSLFILQKQGVFVSFSHGQVPAYAEILWRLGW